MKNRNVGWLIVGLSLVIAIIILIFNLGSRAILGNSCSHGASCTMYSALNIQTWISFAVAGLILIIGLFFIFSKENEKIIVKKIKQGADLKQKKFNKESLKGLDKDEARIMNLVLGNNGSIFQSELVNKTGINKVKITRILDSLEGRGLIERKRRGMTNIVILK